MDFTEFTEVYFLQVRGFFFPQSNSGGEKLGCLSTNKDYVNMEVGRKYIQQRDTSTVIHKCFDNLQCEKQQGEKKVQIIKDKYNNSALIQHEIHKSCIIKGEKAIYVKEELFQYSMRKKMDIAKKIVFCAFLLHFSQRGQLQLDGLHNIIRKGARIEAEQ